MTDPGELMFPYGRVPGGHWSDGELKSLDGCDVGPVQLEDVDEVVHFWSDGDRWDGHEYAVVRLKDGRFVGYSYWRGPTGDSFSEDAYGGDGILYFARDLATIERLALGDEGRRRLGIKLQPEGVEVVYELTLRVGETDPIPEEHALVSAIARRFPEVVYCVAKRA